MATKIPDGDSAAFLREVEDDIRKEQFVTFFRKYGSWLAAGITAVAITAGGYAWWTQHQAKQQQAWNNQFLAALRHADEGKRDVARKELDTLAKDSGYDSYGVLAAFASASLAGREGAATIAGQEYEKLATVKGAVDPLLRSLAIVAAGYRTLEKPWDAATMDSMERLANGGTPWQFSARELLALRAQQDGKPDVAREHWEKLQDGLETPENMKERARQMLAGLPPAEKNTSGMTKQEDKKPVQKGK